MKLLTVFLTVFLLHVSASTPAQQITYSVKEGKLKDALASLERQSGLVFFAASEDLAKAKPVSVEIKNEPLEKALKMLMKDQPLEYTIKGNTIFIRAKTATPVVTTAIDAAPDPLIEVHGTVKDEAGKPVAGVSVLIKGTNKGTVTNEVGFFSLISVDPKATLVFSSINMETAEVKVDSKSDLVVTLKIKVTELADVDIQVNTGYQKLNKERATGSFEFVNAATLNKQVYPNILARLETTTSLLFDKNGGSVKPTISIRGLSSINSSKDPLIILDNFPYNGDFNNINPNDIENVTILKDAASASIWGTRAGNGVIVITTKKARQNQPFNMEFNTSFTAIPRPDLSYLKTISSPDFLDFEQFLFSKKYRFSDTADAYRSSFTPLYELLFSQQKGAVTSDQVNTAIANWSKIDIRDQYQQFMYQPSSRQQYSLNLRGGSKKASFYVGMGYDKSVSELNAPYERYTIRSENSFQPLERLTATIGLSYTNSYARSGRTGFGQWAKQYSYEQLRNDAGIALPINYALRQPYIDTAGGGKLLDWNFYPAEEDNYDYATTRINDLVVAADLNFKILKDLQLSGFYQFQQQTTQQDNVFEKSGYFARNLINTFSSINTATGTVIYRVPSNGILDKTFANRKSQNVRLQLEYNHSWNAHSISAIAGGELRQAVEPSYTNRVFGYDINLQTAINTDLVNTYTNYVTGFQDYIPGNYQANETTNRFTSQFANASYTYSSKYTVSGSIRRDGSNLFGLAANDKWQPLWSTGASWLLSKEKFYSLSWLPMLKFRATFGYSGNVNNSLAAVTTIRYSSSSAPYTNYPYSVVTNYANPELRWEKVQMTNIGFDFAVIHDILGGSIEYYHKNGTDLIGDYPVDPTAGLGATAVRKNVASMAGDGIDISLTATPVKRKLVWQINFILNINKTRITDYYLLTTNGSNYLSSGASITPLIGKPVFSILSYKSAGLDAAGNPQGYVNGQLSIDYSAIRNTATLTSDLSYGGPAMPTTWGSLVQAFKLSNWQLDIGIGYKLGYAFRMPSINYSNLATSYVGNSDYARRWQKPGDEKLTYVPSLTYPFNTNRDYFYNNSDVLVRKADNVRLQFVNLSYSLHRSSIKKLPADQIQLYFNAANVGILWRANKDGIDPDYTGTNSYPQPPSYTMGLRINL